MMVGATVAGILGALLAVPIIATGREIVEYLYDKILEAPPEPAPPEGKPSLLDSVRDRLSKLTLPFGRRAKESSPPEAASAKRTQTEGVRTEKEKRRSDSGQKGGEL